MAVDSKQPGAVNSDRVSFDEDNPATPERALRQMVRHLSEFWEYLSLYFAARWDGIKLSLKNAAIYAALGLIAAIAGAALVVTAVVLTCIGLAQMIGRLTERQWLGNLTVGVVLLALIGAGAYLGRRRIMAASRERTVRKYADRQDQQRVEHGSDAAERARARGH